MVDNMKKKDEKGYCHICGEFTKLTFEHIPPHKAFNYTPSSFISCLYGYLCYD